jgi:hypothetical protein
MDGTVFFEHAVTQYTVQEIERTVRFRVWSSGICGGQNGVGATSISPANLHSTKFSILTITRGRYKKWSTCRVDPVRTPPPLRELKKKIN